MRRIVKSTDIMIKMAHEAESSSVRGVSWTGLGLGSVTFKVAFTMT